MLPITLVGSKHRMVDVVVVYAIMARAKVLSVVLVLRLLLRHWHLAGKFQRLYLIHRVFWPIFPCVIVMFNSCLLNPCLFFAFLGLVKLTLVYIHFYTSVFCNKLLILCGLFPCSPSLIGFTFMNLSVLCGWCL